MKQLELFKLIKFEPKSKQTTKLKQVSSQLAKRAIVSIKVYVTLHRSINIGPEMHQCLSIRIESIFINYLFLTIDKEVNKRRMMGTPTRVRVPE